MHLVFTDNFQIKHYSYLQERQEGYLGNYRPFRLISIPGKVMEQMLLEAISKHTKHKKRVIGSI